MRLTHWVNAVVLVGMMASGLQIYGAYERFGIRGTRLPLPNPLDMHPAPHWARLGGWLAGGLNWHFFLMWPLVLNGLLYLGYLLFAGEWRPLLFRPRDVGPAIEMQKYYLHLRRDHPAQGKHNALQKGAYSFIVLLGVLSVLTRPVAVEAGPALVAHRAVRRLRAGALLALRRGVAVRRVHRRARRAGVRGGSGVVARDAHGLVPGEVSEP